MPLLRLYVFALFLLCSPWSFAISPCDNTVRPEDFTIVTEFLPPYQYLKESGEAAGYSVEIVREILSDADLPADFNYLPWPRAYKTALKKPNTLIFSILRTPLREELFYWIGELHLEQYYFYKLADKDDLKEILPDQQSVAVYNGSPYLEHLREQNFSRIELTESVEQAIKMLLSRRADILLTSNFALKSLLSDLNIEETRLLTMSQDPVFTANLYVAININSEPCLIERLEKSYQRLVKSKRIDLLQDALTMKTDD